MEPVGSQLRPRCGCSCAPWRLKWQRGKRGQVGSAGDKTGSVRKPSCSWGRARVLMPTRSASARIRYQAFRRAAPATREVAMRGGTRRGPACPKVRRFRTARASVPASSLPPQDGEHAQDPFGTHVVRRPLRSTRRPLLRPQPNEWIERVLTRRWTSASGAPIRGAAMRRQKGALLRPRRPEEETIGYAAREETPRGRRGRGREATLGARGADRAAWLAQWRLQCATARASHERLELVHAEARVPRSALRLPGVRGLRLAP